MRGGGKAPVEGAGVGATVGDGIAIGVGEAEGVASPVPGSGEVLGQGNTCAKAGDEAGAVRRELATISEIAAMNPGREADRLELTLSSIRRISLCR